MALLEKIFDALNSNQNWISKDKLIDELFGIKGNIAISNDDKELYAEGISNEALYTSYEDFFQIYNELLNLKIKSFIDIGAGVARSKILFDILKSPWTNTAVEKANERIEQTQKIAKSLNLEHNNYIVEDATKIDYNLYDAFFFYFPVSSSLNLIMNNILYCASIKETPTYVIAVESHGDFFNYLKSHCPWLKIVKTIKTKSNRHNENILLLETNSDMTKKFISKIEIVKDKLKSDIFCLKNLKSEDIWLAHQIISKEDNWVYVIQDSVFDRTVKWIIRANQGSFYLEENKIYFEQPTKTIAHEQIVMAKKSQKLYQECELYLDTIKKIRKIFIDPENSFENLQGQLIKN